MRWRCAGLRTRETVPGCTFASFATSRTVTPGLFFMLELGSVTSVVDRSIEQSADHLHICHIPPQTDVLPEVGGPTVSVSQPDTSLCPAARIGRTLNAQ